MRALATTVVLATATLGACTFLLDWDPEGLPCDSKDECATKYTCLVNRCVGNGSVPKGETCNNPVQCEGYPEITCGTNPFYCRRTCDDFFQTSSCGSGEYCRPERSRDDNTRWEGTCFPSECSNDNQCDLAAGRSCVQITTTAKACLLKCSPAVDINGVYSDNCGSTANNRKVCQPIGPAQIPVCLDLLKAGGLDSAPCAAVAGGSARADACEPELACMFGFCSRYCNAAGPACPVCPPPLSSPGFCCNFTGGPGYSTCICQGSCP